MFEENKYTYNDIERIYNFKTWSDVRKIDTLLEIDCGLYANLGTDSTKEEKKQVWKKSVEIYRIIKRIDKALGDQFLLTMNLKQ